MACARQTGRTRRAGTLLATACVGALLLACLLDATAAAGLPAASDPSSAAAPAEPAASLLPPPDADPPADTSAMASITHAAAVRASPTLPPLRPGAAQPTCAGCSDYRRDAYTCAQQRDWGCDRSWMAGFCDKTCGRCTCACPCTDASPKADATCRQLSDWGFCPLEDEGNAFMAGWCEVSCGRCPAARGGSGVCAPPAPSSGANVCEGRCYNRIADPPPAPSVVDGAVGASGTGGAEGAPSHPAGAGRPPSSFVTVRDGAFYLEGAPWFFAGTNWYSALYPWWSDDQVAAGLAAHAAKGASVVRVFAFTNGRNNTGYDMTLQTQPIQPSIGVFSEDGLARLDLVVDAAGRAGLKLILALSNVWDEGGGAQWYVDSVLGPDPATGGRRPRELFYSSRPVIEAFKAYVRVVLTRTNGRNGLPYAADPAIMAWELCNEPQTASYWEAERGLVPGAAMTAWAAEISGLIKQLAPRQLTCMGDEGWRVDGVPGKAARRHARAAGGCAAAASPPAPFPATGLTPRPPVSMPGYEWMNDGAKGVDSVALARMPTLDFQTIHVYAPNWGLRAEDYAKLFTPFLADRAALARAAGKPIILEEFGSPYGYVADRDAFISAYSTAAAALGYAGALFWQVSPFKTRSSTGAGFDIGYDNAGGAAVRAMYESWNARARLERGQFWE